MLNERTILKQILMKKDMRVWTELVQDRVWWQTLVGTVMNLLVP